MTISDRERALRSEDDIPGKIRDIHSLLAATKPNVAQLRRLCVLPGGLLTNSLRKQAWPLIVGAYGESSHPEPSDEEMHAHRDYRVVELDVERLLKRYPPDLAHEDRLVLEKTMKRIIMRSIHDPQDAYYYYQGYHDIAITVYLVLRDEEASVAVLRRLCRTHLSVFMRPTLLETVDMLNYIYPLIKRCNPDLHDFLIRSDIGTMFALPWLITWFGHNIQENVPSTLIRLCDLFIASDPYMPIYLGAAIVASLSHQILSLPEDQAEVHGFLNYLSPSLPWELLIKDALDLHLQFPPASIASEAALVPQLQEEAREARSGRPVKKGPRKPEAPQPSWLLKATVITGIVVLVAAFGVARYFPSSASDTVANAKDMKTNMHS